MDRLVLRRRPVVSALAIILGLGLWPTAPGHAKRPDTCEMTAGDPGDGVLRTSVTEPQSPAVSVEADAASSGASRPSPQYLLVPVAAPAGQPWTFCFRLVRIVHGGTDPVLRAFPAGGRWHRAP